MRTILIYANAVGSCTDFYYFFHSIQQQNSGDYSALYYAQECMNAKRNETKRNANIPYFYNCIKSSHSSHLIDAIVHHQLNVFNTRVMAINSTQSDALLYLHADYTVSVA